MRRLFIGLPFTKIRISIFSIILVAAVFFADASVYTFELLLAAFLHECGHVASMKAFGVKIHSIEILPSGALICSDSELLEYKKEAVIAISGVFINLIFALTAYVFYLFIGDIYSLFFCLSNALLLLINIVPVKTLDGNRALTAIIYGALPYEKAQKIMDTVEYLSFVLLVFLAWGLLMLTGCNFSLVIFCVYIFFGVYARDELKISSKAFQ